MAHATCVRNCILKSSADTLSGRKRSTGSIAELQSDQNEHLRSPADPPSSPAAESAAPLRPPPAPPPAAAACCSSNSAPCHKRRHRAAPPGRLPPPASASRSRAKKSPVSHTGPTTSTDARLPCPRPHRHNLVMRLVERRPDQVVHRRIRNHKRLLPVALHLQHPRHQRSRLRHQKPPRLKQQLAFETLQRLLHRRRILRAPSPPDRNSPPW